MRDERFPAFSCISFLCGMNNIERGNMRKMFLLCFALIVVSCGLEEVSRRPGGNDTGVWIRPGSDAPADDSEKPAAFITAVDYPDGYDWRADREKGTVKCSLVVYADGVPMMKVPVGDTYEVSSDPDMHRMVNGHLYTDYSTDSETVIKRDGKEIIRYPGREMICDIVEYEGVVHLLGHDRSGEGFTYRKDGEIILERTGGRSFGRFLQAPDSCICFAFSESVAADKAIERYYVFADGEVTQTAVREDVKKVWDITSYNGGICYLASVVGISSPVLFCSGEMKALKMPSLSDMLTSRIMPVGDRVFVEGLCRREGKFLTSCLWNDAGQVYMFADGMMVSSLCVSGDGICCVLNGFSPSGVGAVYRCGETFPMPPDYISMGAATSTVINGILHAGLSSLAGGAPLIWKDGETIPLKINGFISSISAGRD